MSGKTGRLTGTVRPTWPQICRWGEASHRAAEGAQTTAQESGPEFFPAETQGDHSHLSCPSCSSLFILPLLCVTAPPREPIRHTHDCSEFNRPTLRVPPALKRRGATMRRRVPSRLQAGTSALRTIAPLPFHGEWPQAGNKPRLPSLARRGGQRPGWFSCSTLSDLRHNRPTLRVPPALTRRGAQISTTPHANVVLFRQGGAQPVEPVVLGGVVHLDLATRAGEVVGEHQPPLDQQIRRVKRAVQAAT